MILIIYQFLTDVAVVNNMGITVTLTLEVTLYAILDVTLVVELGVELNITLLWIIGEYK